MEEKREIKKEKGKIGWIIPLIIFVLVVSSCWATWYFLVDADNRGTFGDMFGITNAFFSGLAFGGVIYAIILQRRELQFQREELELTRMELKGQKQQLEAQNTTLKKQNFESTFFQLLRLHNDITNSIEVPDSSHTGSTPIKGKHCFGVLYSQFREIFKLYDNEPNDNDRINAAYLDFYRANQNVVGHYFRNLYAIVKFVENSEVEDVELYVNLIRVQLTGNELLLLFYNSLSDTDSKNLKPLIEKYALLKSLPKDDLLLPKRHGSLYKKGAYITIWSTIPNTSNL